MSDSRPAAEPDGAAYLSRIGFVLYFTILIGSSVLACDCAVIAGVSMGVCSLMPIAFGSRLQRLAGVLCLAIACGFATWGLERKGERKERHPAINSVQQAIPTR